MSRDTITVGHILNGLPRAGNENLCFQLIRHAPAGVRQVLFNLNPPKSEMKEQFLSIPGLTLVERPYTRDTRVSFMLGMISDVKKYGLDGVIIYPFGVHVLVASAVKLAGVHRVIVHAGNPPPADGSRRLLWKRILMASRLLRTPIKSCSAMVDRELRALYSPLPDGSEPVLNGVEVEAIEAMAASERAGKPPGSPRVIGMVARLDAIKDHDTLVRAFARVREQEDNLELWLIGEGSRRGALTSLVDELGIRTSVRFLGERSDVHRLLGQMDLFVFSTTRDEGFGIALAEAMAARVPIVASDVPACREVLQGGEAGRLVPPMNVGRLSEAILEFLHQPELAKSFADRAHARALRHLHIDRCAEHFYAHMTRRA
jgi:glycosyltransferase involved in cell wall biosynthesis